MQQVRNATTVFNDVLTQQNAQHNWLVPSHSIVMEDNADGMHFTVDSALVASGLSEIAHDNLSGITEIPGRFYDRLRENPKTRSLLAHNVNTLLRERSERPQLIRGSDLNGLMSTRAILSAGYQIRDNWDAINALAPVWQNNGNLLKSTEITEKHMYLQVLSPKQAYVAKGDVVQAGFSFSNSEVGLGSTTFKAWIYRLACTNGLILPESLADASFSKAHLGARRNEFGRLAGLISEATRRKEQEVFWDSLRDAATGLLAGDFLQNAVAALQSAQGDEIIGSPVKAVEVAAERLLLSEAEKDRVIEHLLGDQNAGGLTKYGLINAVTATAQEATSADRTIDLEKIGGNLLVLPKSDWQAIATAA